MAKTPAKTITSAVEAAAPSLPPFTGFTPIAEAHTILLRFHHMDTEASAFTKGNVIENGRYSAATVAGCYIVQGGFVVELTLRDGSTATLFSNAEFYADVRE